MSYFFSLILLSAGKGTRFEAKKQFQELNGSPLWLYSLNTFLKIKSIKEIIWVIDEGDKHKYEEPLKRIYQPSLPVAISFISGGVERYHSSFKGINQVDGKSDFVLIHDVARPFIHERDLTNLIAGLENKTQAVIPATPISDSVKMISEGNCIEKSLPREKLICASTPQIFPTALIKKAFARFMKEEKSFPTDDSEIFLNEGYKVKYYLLTHPNPKITFKNDLFYFEELAKKTKLPEF